LNYFVDDFHNSMSSMLIYRNKAPNSSEMSPLLALIPINKVKCSFVDVTTPEIDRIW